MYLNSGDCYRCCQKHMRTCGASGSCRRPWDIWHLRHKFRFSNEIFCEFLLKFCLIEVTEKFDVTVGMTLTCGRSPDLQARLVPIRLPREPSSGVRLNVEGEQLPMCCMSG